MLLEFFRRPRWRQIECRGNCHTLKLAKPTRCARNAKHLSARSAAITFVSRAFAKDRICLPIGVVPLRNVFKKNKARYKKNQCICFFSNSITFFPSTLPLCLAISIPIKAPSLLPWFSLISCFTSFSSSSSLNNL